MYEHLQNLITWGQLKKNTKNGVIVDSFSIVWNATTRKAEGMYKNNKVVPFTSVQQYTYDLWCDNH
jgi:hypothetical protein